MLRKQILTAILAFASAISVPAQTSVAIRNLEGRTAAVPQGVSWGVPFAKSTVMPGDRFSLTAEDGSGIEADIRVLASWPDGSVKWLGLSAVAGCGTEASSLDITPASRRARRIAPARAAEGIASQRAGGITIDTGAMSCVFPDSGEDIIRDMSTGGTTVSSAARLVARMGDESFTGRIEKVTLLHNSPVKAVVKVEGRHCSSSRSWLPFAVYCTMYRGLATISMTHSFIFDSDGRDDMLTGLGVAFEVPFREEDHNRHIRIAGSGDEGSGFWCQPVRLAPGYRPSAGRIFADNYAAYLLGARLPDKAGLSGSERDALLTCPVWGDARLVQSNSNGFTLDKRTSPESSWVHVTDGTRSIGGALLGDCSGSLFVGVKDFWQSCPSALYIDRAGQDSGTLTAWLWAPDAEPMDMRHYDTVGHDLKINYEDYKEGWESPYGVGHRSTLEIRLFDSIPSNEELWEVASAVQKPAQYTCTPEYYYSVHAFGDYWGLPDRSTGTSRAIEDQISATLAYYRDQVEQRSWYGFWDYGDIMHNYDFTRHDWRYDIGGWAWNNIELAPNVLLWTCFLRTGREDYWTMAEAMEKHSSEVDVHHIGRFAPLGSRHNVKHWGDGCKQPRIEYAAMKRYLYYLTGGDELTGDLMTEQLGSDKAYEYARRVSTWGAVDGTYIKGSLNDWAYYASNWMIEWERTGDTFYRDRLLDSMKDIVALGSMSGRLVFDYFDTGSGRFMVYLKEKPGQRGSVHAPESDFAPAASLSQKKIREILGYRIANVRGDTFSQLFGAPEFLSELRLTVDYPEFWALTDNSFSDVAGAGGGSMTGPRMAAWAAHSRGDEAMASLAWKNLLDNGFTDNESDGTKVVPHDGFFSSRNIIKPVEEPSFLGQTAGWQRHTPSSAQWILNAIEVLEWTRGIKSE